jgi:hypothetical protein
VKWLVAAAVVLVLGAAGVAFVAGWLPGSASGGQAHGGTGLAAPTNGASESAGGTASASAASTGASAANVPDKGAGTWAYAGGTGAVVGSAGNVRRYRVAVENGSGQDVGAFAAAVEKILADPRGWTAGGTVRLQRVPEKSAAEVTIYLATPATTEQVCAAGGLHVQKFLSCRLPGQIVVNLGRWLTAVPDYGAGLEVYQQFAVNHELGRDLGYANEACPARGRPAPVMQQQSLGLEGCTANPWPYPDGKLYQGHPLP